MVVRRACVVAAAVVCAAAIVLGVLWLSTLDGEDYPRVLPDGSVEYEAGVITASGAIVLPGGLMICLDGTYYEPEGLGASLGFWPSPLVKRDQPCD